MKNVISRNPRSTNGVISMVILFTALVFATAFLWGYHFCHAVGFLLKMSGNKLSIIKTWQNRVYRISWRLMFSASIERLGPEFFFSKLLQSKTAVWVCIFLAWLNKAAIAWLYTDLEGDKSLYLLFAKSLLEGNSLLEPVHLVSNGQPALIYDPAVISPLYSLLAAPFLWITGSYSSTSVLIDILSWGLFFTGLYKVSFALYKERWVSNLLIICTGFFLYPHEMDSGPKDTLSIGLLFWSIYFVYKHISSNSMSVSRSLLLVLFLCAFGLSKYLYTPVILLLLLILLLYSLRTNNRPRLYQALGVIVICALATYSFFNILLPAIKETAVQGVYLPSDGTVFTKGFYPENLVPAFPFISSSIINTNFWGVQLSDILGVSFSAIQRCFQLLDLIVLAGLLYLLKKNINSLSRTLFFILFSISFFLIATLLYMSLRHEGIHYKGAETVGLGWTYVADARSFLFPMLSLQILFFFVLFKTNILHPILRNFLFLLFFIECIHGLYFTTKQIIQATAIRKYDSTASPVKRLVRGMINLKADYRDVALITSDAHLRRYATLQNIPVYTFSSQPCVGGVLPKNILYVIATTEADSALVKGCFPLHLLQPTDAVPPFEVQFYKAKW